LKKIAAKHEKRTIRETILIGDAIKNALESYAQLNNEFPEDLNELVPNFLPELKQPQWGMKKWRYNRQSNNYELSVGHNKNNYPVLFTASGSGWHLDN
jgi:hypothetical protein